MTTVQPGAPPRRPRTLLVLSLSLGLAVLLLLIATPFTIRAMDPGRFETTDADEVADQHGVTPVQYQESVEVLRATFDVLRPTDEAVGQFYVQATAGPATLDVQPLLEGLDEADPAAITLPAAANPEVAELKQSLDTEYAAYRGQLETLATASAELAETGCHPSELGSGAPERKALLAPLRECSRELGEMAGSDSPLAPVASATVPYLEVWIRRVQAEDPVGADTARSVYLQAYSGTLQRLTAIDPRRGEPVRAALNNLFATLERAAYVPSGT